MAGFPFPRHTVFWRVAGVLVGVQVATALVAVALSAAFASARSERLVRGTVELRLDALAEEVETRAATDVFGSLRVPARLRPDLVTRFPDPLAILDATGAVVDTFGAGGRVPSVPAAAVAALDSGRVAVVTGGADGSWALAPLLAPDGLPAGAVLVRPLTRTLDEELRETREAFRTATLVTAFLAALVALGLGAVVTARLVRPLRRMTARVERLGAGDAAGRLPDEGPDEMGRLAAGINDMAARVEASIADLRATDRLRRDLVANVGHDLRTPLAALAAGLEEAERFAAEGRPADAADALAAARRQAAGAADLVADLFELSLLDRPEAPLRLAPVPLGELAADVAGRFERTFAAAGIAFVRDLPPGLPVLDADGARLVRLLSNLLDNAARHTPRGGTITLGARADADTATVWVADTGVGIAPDDLPTVFERYARGTTARTRGVEGTGLGLAIARAVASAHGGTLTAESAPGAGARFTLSVPRHPRGADILAPMPSEAPASVL
ncbi:MAG TPA: HAMP domain-containing sensor histidine kinase [Rubricoccaceae bacterium]|jgi:signal transduction histidine kinase